MERHQCRKYPQPLSEHLSAGRGGETEQDGRNAVWKEVGYVDLAPVKELVSLQRRCANNLNQVAVHANTFGVYPEEIAGLQRDYEKLWGRVADVLTELSVLVEK